MSYTLLILRSDHAAACADAVDVRQTESARGLPKRWEDKIESFTSRSARGRAAERRPRAGRGASR